ncbi:STAS domain-containing protein [Adhaeribacter aquaticus]|uniref:STAS domain-containing protein n=1 Tax=Adhaeribacter aquaticus TaxID=299567 RepID=UPI00047D0B95|nr:STAS domain-containing protein [Adhaeribacter aquaticus]
MDISLRIEDHNFILKLKGDYDASASQKLATALEEGVRSFCSNIILDLAELKYITTTGQRTLVSYLNKIQKLDMQLILCQAKPDVEYSLKESGLIRLFKIASSIREAKAASTPFAV